MSFLAELDALPLAGLRERAEHGSQAAARESLGKAHLTLADFAYLLSPAAGAELETMQSLDDDLEAVFKYLVV